MMWNSITKPLFLAGCLLAMPGLASLAHADKTDISTGQAALVDKNYQEGIARLKARAWDLAISNFNQTLSVDPRNVPATEGAAYAYAAKSDWDKSMDFFSRAIELHTTNAATYLNRGTLYRAQREYDKAMDDYDTCLRLDPANIDALTGRAETYLKIGKYYEAANDITLVLGRYPKNGAALVFRANAYTKVLEYDKALADFYRAMSVAPREADIFNDFAWFRATCPITEMRNGAEAVKAATRACELTRWGRWQYIDTLAAACAENRDFAGAVRFEQQAMAVQTAGQYDLALMQDHLALFQRQLAYRDE